MAWFKRNQNKEVPPAGLAPAPNLQDLKRKARNRLIGMVVLILAAIASFALLLDSEPRQTEREIVYEIPEKGERVTVKIPAKAKPAAPVAPSADQPVAESSDKISDKSSLAANEALVDTPETIRARRKAALAANAQEEVMIDEAPIAAGSDEPQADDAAIKAAEQKRAAEHAKAEKLAKEKAAQDKADKELIAKQKAEDAKLANAQIAQEKAAQEKKAKEKAAKEKAAKEKLAKEEAAKKAAADKKAEAERARALLEGGAANDKPKEKPAAKPEGKTETASGERSVVQFGSFNDAAKAAEVRRKVEGAGLKTYAQEIDTPRGKMIRLRVGPFTKPADAEAAAKKIKALGLPAAVLTL